MVKRKKTSRQQRALQVLGRAITLLGFLVVFAGCSGPHRSIVILSGSENQTLEPLVKEWAASQGVDVTLTYQGSVDIMLGLQQKEPGFDAVWPANSLWLTLGDEQRRLRYAKSIMTSPVVFGVRKSLATQLGLLVGPVHVADLLKLVQAGKLRFAMTSASQSNSGATAYLGFLMAFRGGSEPLSSEDLRKPELRAKTASLLRGVERSSGSSAWLKDLFLAGNYDAMVNYESLIIETNQELVKQGREPLAVVYPVDGISIADSPLAFFPRSADPALEQDFRSLQAWLLQEPQQKRILELGRRTGLGGELGSVDKQVFNPDWGIDVERILSPFRLPEAPVIREALSLYQTELRKPSLLVLCLDFSGSMQENGGELQLKQAMDLLLDPVKSGQYILQPGLHDRFQIILFANQTLDTRDLVATETSSLKDADTWIQNTQAGGGTDIFSPVIQGLDWLKTIEDLKAWNPAIVLLTDGQSNTGRSLEDALAAYKTFGADIPIYTIAFGDADDKQLRPLSDVSHGRFFDGRADIVSAMRAVRGYN